MSKNLFFFSISFFLLLSGVHMGSSDGDSKTCCYFPEPKESWEHTTEFSSKETS